MRFLGGISKKDLRMFVSYAKDKFKLPILGDIYSAVPTAELEPLVQGKIAQTDEQDMGMTYNELNQFGLLRKVEHCGPYSMYCKLVQTWSDTCTPKQVAEKVKHFFRSVFVSAKCMFIY